MRNAVWYMAGLITLILQGYPSSPEKPEELTFLPLYVGGASKVNMHCKDGKVRNDFTNP
jgi:hypothetical protein